GLPPMANREQLAMLKRGVEKWNAWRVAHRDVPIDLREASFRGADLTNALLYRANLSEAYLRGAYLLERPSATQILPRPKVSIHATIRDRARLTTAPWPCQERCRWRSCAVSACQTS